MQTIEHALDRADQAIAALVDHLADATLQSDQPHRVSTSKLHGLGCEAFLVARLIAETRAARALLVSVEGAGPNQRRLAGYAVGRVVRDLEATLVREAATFCGGVDVRLDLSATTRDAVIRASGPYAVNELAPWLSDRGASSPASYALGRDHEDIRVLFRDFADEQVAPLAEAIHRDDALLPESLLQAYSEIGVLGITIPEEYGGQFVDHRTMALATEELSRASLGAGGSVITRPEIAAKALLEGGTETQKKRWLPRIASGQEVVSIAVTKPNAGSDVASLRLSAERVDGGYVLSGEKTWCTFAGRASVLLVLARTGSEKDRARGLTLFLVEKPATKAPQDDRSFQHEDGRGGTLSGRAIPTVGYRGMHSFTVFFDRWFVADDCRVGAEGDGFGLQMTGFAGGRIQTAARAVGVMEAAFRSAVAYTRERHVFGRALSSLPLVQGKLADMAARIALARQMTYAVCDLMDAGAGQMEASLVKLMACKDAEHVTREAMQLHGGMGYSEEFAVSRYWQDARVLSIFEGAEEVLAILVIARSVLRDTLSRRKMAGA